MSDLRQGVTPGAHDVLDLVDQLRDRRDTDNSPRALVAQAETRMAYLRQGGTSLAAQRADAAHAAARLIAFIELADAQIEADEEAAALARRAEAA